MTRRTASREEAKAAAARTEAAVAATAAADAVRATAARAATGRAAQRTASWEDAEVRLAAAAEAARAAVTRSDVSSAARRAAARVEPVAGPTATPRQGGPPSKLGTAAACPRGTLASSGARSKSGAAPRPDGAAAGFVAAQDYRDGEASASSGRQQMVWFLVCCWHWHASLVRLTET